MLAPLRFAGIRRAGVQVPVTAGVHKNKYFSCLSSLTFTRGLQRLLIL